jgi:hypothetical protein
VSVQARPPAPEVRSTARPSELREEEIVQIIGQGADQYRQSPLKDETVRRRIAAAMVRASAETGVPAWLMLTHMQFENGFGNPKDGTMRSKPIYVGAKKRVGEGLSHNLFGLTRPRAIADRCPYILTTSMPQGLRVFDNY